MSIRTHLIRVLAKQRLATRVRVEGSSNPQENKGSAMGPEMKHQGRDRDSKRNTRELVQEKEGKVGLGGARSNSEILPEDKPSLC